MALGRVCAILLCLAMVFICVVLHRHMNATAMVRSDISRHIHVGSADADVRKTIELLDMECAAFDYPSGPRQGTLLIAKTRPILAFQEVYVVFHLDHRSPGGKLTDLDISDAPIDVPAP